MADWILAIDFGTTYTVAAHAELQEESRTGTPRLVNWEREGPRLSSAVWLDDEGELVVGPDAINQFVFAPDRYEPTPKRRISDGKVWLGPTRVPVEEIVGAVLRKVAVEASRLRGGTPPVQVHLTHPAAWSEARTSVLRKGAEHARLPCPHLLTEPEAAAICIAANHVEIDAHVAIYDFGGGTFDTAVLRRTAAGFELAGKPGGKDPLGGEDIDQRIIDYLGGTALSSNPKWHMLLDPPDVSWERTRESFRREVRRAKESLSSSPATKLWIPGLDRDWQLTQKELVGLIRKDVEATVDILEQTILDAGLTPNKLAGTFLVGGSSRIPVVHDTVWRRFGRRPETQEDPKAVVALGAVTQIDNMRPPSPSSPLASRPALLPCRTCGQQFPGLWRVVVRNRGLYETWLVCGTRPECSPATLSEPVWLPAHPKPDDNRTATSAAGGICRVCGQQFPGLWRVVVRNRGLYETWLVCGTRPECSPATLSEPVWLRTTRATGAAD